MRPITYIRELIQTGVLKHRKWLQTTEEDIQNVPSGGLGAIFHDGCDWTREFPLSGLVVYILFLKKGNNSRPLSARWCHHTNKPTVKQWHSMKITRKSNTKQRGAVALLSSWLHSFLSHYNHSPSLLRIIAHLSFKDRSPFVPQGSQPLCLSRITVPLTVAPLYLKDRSPSVISLTKFTDPQSLKASSPMDTTLRDPLQAST